VNIIEETVETIQDVVVTHHNTRLNVIEQVVETIQDVVIEVENITQRVAGSGASTSGFASSGTRSASSGSYVKGQRFGYRTGGTRTRTGKEFRDDLTKIEGIGPKIAELLNNANVWTYEDLAYTAPTRLTEILEAAGSRFSMHNPETWPAQSALAADGDWAELKAWQDELDGGRK
jgi:predicted flap endonuclease-1-like 5' DNA nuclease